MNLVHVMIDLRPGARALSFAAACEAWMGHLQVTGAIRGWRLLRRKFGLAASCYGDFILEIEVEGLTQLDAAFAQLASADEAAEGLYDQVHQMVGRAEVGLFRPYPDPSQRERIALI